MFLLRRSLVPAFTLATLFTLACSDSNGPSGLFQVTTSLSRQNIVPGDTMTIKIAVTSLTPPPAAGPGGCNFPSFVVRNLAGQVVDQGELICAVSSDAAGFPVATATYIWSAEPWVCDAGACRQVPLPMGRYSVTGEYLTPNGPVASSSPQYVEVMGQL